jgi:hypothetical protein
MEVNLLRFDLKVKVQPKNLNMLADVKIITNLMFMLIGYDHSNI